ncbi:MAG: urease accessory protein UreD [Phormidesmis sp.]
MHNRYQNTLELHLKCDRDRPYLSDLSDLSELSNCAHQTICAHQYTTYPLRLSTVFRLEGANTSRAYLYTMNTSPGLLAKDALKVDLKLAENAHLYLTDQAATKVHPMPIESSQATVDYQIELRSHASLELVPEPIILYSEAALTQNTAVRLDRTAKLFLSEIVLPGRLARGEYYQFRYYFNRLTLTDLGGKLLFTDATRLQGKANAFKDNHLFAPLPVMGSAIAIYPNLDLTQLSKALDNIQSVHFPSIMVSNSILPSDCGLLIRGFAHKAVQLKQYFKLALEHIRKLANQPALPYVPK